MKSIATGVRVSCLCPVCNGKLTRRNLREFGKCAACRNKETEQIHDVTPERRAQLLAEHDAWMKQHPTAWDRAVSGLRMFVPDDDRYAYWP